MSKFYTSEDVDRWEKVDLESIALQLDKLKTESTQRGIDFRLGMLSLSYYALGMTRIAQRAFDQAIEAIRASAESRCTMYERWKKGIGRPMEAGCFQYVLVAFVTRDAPLVERLVQHYRADDGTKGSMYLGTAMKLIATGNLAAAQVALSKKRPQFEKQFVGYAECLEAIANQDERGFQSALSLALKSWTKWVSRAERGLPDSVCFIKGIGMVHLAERVLDRRIRVSNEYMPVELLS